MKNVYEKSAILWFMLYLFTLLCNRCKYTYNTLNNLSHFFMFSLYQKVKDLTS